LVLLPLLWQLDNPLPIPGNTGFRASRPGLAFVELRIGLIRLLTRWNRDLVS
jgi:hypothetical protein